MTNEEYIEYGLKRLSMGKASDVMNFSYADTLDYIQRLKAENAELKARLEAAGIGDVSEYKDKELSCANSVTDMIAACDKCGLSECIGCEHDYTAAQEVKELALADEVKQYKIDDLEVKCEVLQRDVDNLTRTLEEGGEEFEEANRRAEVAEQALLIASKEALKLSHKVKVAERALQIAEELGELCAPRQYYIDKAKKELAEENKE